MTSLSKSGGQCVHEKRIEKREKENWRRKPENKLISVSLCLSRLLKHWHDVYKCTFKISIYHLVFVVMALEDQKANLTRELNSIKHTHNKVCHLSSLCICFSLALACWLVTFLFPKKKSIFFIQLVLTHRDLLEKKKEWESESSTFR